MVPWLCCPLRTLTRAGKIHIGNEIHEDALDMVLG